MNKLQELNQHTGEWEPLFDGREFFHIEDLNDAISILHRDGRINTHADRMRFRVMSKLGSEWRPIHEFTYKVERIRLLRDADDSVPQPGDDAYQVLADFHGLGEWEPLASGWVMTLHAVRLTLSDLRRSGLLDTDDDRRKYRVVKQQDGEWVDVPITKPPLGPFS